MNAIIGETEGERKPRTRSHCKYFIESSLCDDIVLTFQKMTLATGRICCPVSSQFLDRTKEPACGAPLKYKLTNQEHDLLQISNTLLRYYSFVFLMFEPQTGYSLCTIVHIVRVAICILFTCYRFLYTTIYIARV